jgi:ABC-type polysaccharide/polyol phosphate transport system ATPase subunit
VVLASHNFQMLRKVCNTGLVMEAGRLAYVGPVNDAIQAYKDIYHATKPKKPKVAAN